MYPHLRLVVDPTVIPWVFITETIDKQYCTGILCGLLEYVSKSLNFSYEFVKELDGIGHELSNGSWVGFMGRILKDVNHFQNSKFSRILIKICLLYIGGRRGFQSVRNG
jgi:hypothetical protein